MTTYEKFIESKTKEIDRAILWEYDIYIINGTQFSDENDEFCETFRIENSEEWFSNNFMEFLYTSVDNDEIDFEFDYFVSNNYKLQVCNDYFRGQYNEDDEQDLFEFDEELKPQIKQMREDKDHAITMTFYNSYLNNLTFEYFKTLLYENGIYNDIFADQVDLK